MTRNRLYLLLFGGIAISYGWVAWQLSKEHKHLPFTPCPFKNITGIACPSCGITRSLALLAHGRFADAAYINPLGLFAGLIMVIAPLWLLYDVITGSSSLLKGYHAFEKFLQKKYIAIPLIALIVANWGWNIYKGL